MSTTLIASLRKSALPSFVEVLYECGAAIAQTVDSRDDFGNIVFAQPFEPRLAVERPTAPFDRTSQAAAATSRSPTPRIAPTKRR